MSDTFDNYLKNTSRLWYIYSDLDKTLDINNNISWKLQEGHSGPILKITYNYNSELFSTDICDHFYQFCNINPSTFLDDEIKRYEIEEISFYE